MSGKSDVVDRGIVESYGARTLRSNDRQRHERSGLAAFALQNVLHATQNERPRRAALACRPRLQLTVHAVGNVDSRAHEPIVPYLWRRWPRATVRPES